MWLTLQIIVESMGRAEYLAVDHQMRVHLSVLEGHARQRQVICSIVRYCEDSGSTVVAVTNVTDDLVEDDDRTSVEDLTIV